MIENAHTANLDRVVALEDCLKRYAMVRPAPQAISVALCSVDKIDQYRAAWGGGVIGPVLSFVARTLRRQAPDHCLISSCGFAGFAILLPSDHIDQAAELAEKMRTAAKAHAMTRRSTGERMDVISLSFGIGQWLPQEGARDVARRVDEALASAIERGGDCTVRERASASQLSVIQFPRRALGAPARVRYAGLLTRPG